jgi:hypothetical protein
VFAAHPVCGSLEAKRGGFLFASPSGPEFLQEFLLFEPEKFR